MINGQEILRQDMLPAGNAVAEVQLPPSQRDNAEILEKSCSSSICVGATIHRRSGIAAHRLHARAPEQPPRGLSSTNARHETRGLMAFATAWEEFARIGHSAANPSNPQPKGKRF